MRVKSIFLGLLVLTMTASACFFVEEEALSSQNSDFSSQNEERVESSKDSISIGESVTDNTSESTENDSEGITENDSEGTEKDSESVEKEDDSAETERYFTVTFDTDGGGEVASVSVLEGEKIPTPKSPIKEDKNCEYIFLGWYYNGEAWDFENGVVTQDMTLTAKWKEGAQYTNPFLPKDE